MDTQTVILNFVAGTVLPFIAFIFDKHLPKAPFWKYVTVLGVSGLAGVLIVVQQGNFITSDIFGSVALVATVAQSVYMAFLKQGSFKKTETE